MVVTLGFQFWIIQKTKNKPHLLRCGKPKVFLIAKDAEISLFAPGPYSGKTKFFEEKNINVGILILKNEED